MLERALLAKGALHATNIDTLFTSGIWRTTVDGTGTYPTSGKTGLLEVLVANEACVQIFFEHTGNIYTRFYESRWSNWNKIKFEN